MVPAENFLPPEFPELEQNELMQQNAFYFKERVQHLKDVMKNFSSMSTSEFIGFEKPVFPLRKFPKFPTFEKLPEVEHDFPPVIENCGSHRKLIIKFDVTDYRPEEIVIRTDDGVLKVMAKHEHKSGKKKATQEYVRQYTLPKGVTNEDLVCSLGNNGVLTVEAVIPNKSSNNSLKIGQ